MSHRPPAAAAGSSSDYHHPPSTHLSAPRTNLPSSSSDWRFLFKDGLQLILLFLHYTDWRNAASSSRVWFGVASLARSRKWTLAPRYEDIPFWTHCDIERASRWSLRHHVNSLSFGFYYLSCNQFARILRAAPYLERFDGHFELNPEESRPSSQALTGLGLHLKILIPRFGTTNNADASVIITVLIEAFGPSLRTFYLERQNLEVPLTRLERLETFTINSAQTPPNAWLEQLAAILNQLPQLVHLSLPRLYFHGSSYFIQRLRLPNLKVFGLCSKTGLFDGTKLLDLHAACPMLEKLPVAVFLPSLHLASMPHWATLREVGFRGAPEKLQKYQSTQESPSLDLDPQMVLQTELNFVTLLVSCTQITHLSFTCWAPSETMVWKQIGASLISLERLQFSHIRYLGSRPFFIIDSIDVSLALRLKELRVGNCSLASVPTTLHRFPNLESLFLTKCLDTVESIETALLTFDDSNFLPRLQTLYISQSQVDPLLFIEFSIPHRQNVVKFKGRPAERNKLHRRYL